LSVNGEIYEFAIRIKLQQIMQFLLICLSL